MELFFLIALIVNFLILLYVIVKISHIERNTKAIARIAAIAFDKELENFIETSKEQEDLMYLNKRLIRTIKEVWR